MQERILIVFVSLVQKNPVYTNTVSIMTQCNDPRAKTRKVNSAKAK